MRWNRNRLFWTPVIVWVAVVVMVGWAAAPTQADVQLNTTAAQQSIDAQLENLLITANLGDSAIGVMIVDPATGNTLAQHNARQPFIPASNMKLLTSGTALSVLGADADFTTELVVVRESVGAGGEPGSPITRVIVRGSGDPAFGDPKLLARMDMSVDELLALWIEALAAAGVQGGAELIVDDRVFDREFVHPTWPPSQLNRWYCAEVSGLVFHTNTLSVFPTPGEVDNAPVLSTEPDAPWIRITNRARTVRKGDHTPWIARPKNTNTLTLRGDIRYSGNPVEVTLHDNPTFFAELLADRMRQAGFTPAIARVATTNEVLPRGEVIHRVRTEMPTLLERCNTDSHNLYAECLLKLVGHRVTGSPGSWRNGSAVVRMELSRRVGPSITTGVSIADGSGMSRENRVSPEAITAWLTSFVNDGQLREPFLQSLPEAGKTGTQRKRFRERRPVNTVRAKTGFLTGVSAMSGVVVDEQSGRTVVFCVFVNEKPHTVPLRRVRDFEEHVALLADTWLTESLKEATVGAVGE